MSDWRAITLQSAILKQQQDADSLIVGAGVKTSSGSLTITAASGSIVIASGSTLSVTGTGMINLPSQFQINASAVSTNVTAANLDTLTGGPATVADALHTHAGLGGGISYTEIEIDFGSQPTNDALFTITDAACTGTKKIIAVPSGNAATGRTSDDYQWDGITFSGLAGTGVFTLYAKVDSPCTVVGKRKLYYTLA